MKRVRNETTAVAIHTSKINILMWPKSVSAIKRTAGARSSTDAFRFHFLAPNGGIHIEATNMPAPLFQGHFECAQHTHGLFLLILRTAFFCVFSTTFAASLAHQILCRIIVEEISDEKVEICLKSNGEHWSRRAPLAGATPIKMLEHCEGMPISLTVKNK